MDWAFLTVLDPPKGKRKRYFSLKCCFVHGWLFISFDFLARCWFGITTFFGCNSSLWFIKLHQLHIYYRQVGKPFGLVHISKITLTYEGIRNKPVWLHHSICNEQPRIQLQKAQYTKVQAEYQQKDHNQQKYAEEKKESQDRLIRYNK